MEKKNIHSKLNLTVTKKTHYNISKMKGLKMRRKMYNTKVNTLKSRKYFESFSEKKFSKIVRFHIEAKLKVE